MDEIPTWFWQVLDSTRPHLSALEAWIVSQGHDYWAAVVSGEHTVADVVEVYLYRPSPPGAAPVRWTDDVANPAHKGYQAPWCIAHGVYLTRFGEEISDHID